MFSPVISKTDYLSYLQRPKRLWLSKKPQELKSPISETTQRVFDQRFEVEDLAHKLFTNGVEIEGWYKKGHDETQQYIKDGKKTIYQANALPKDLYCKADILNFNDKTKKWDLYEVKSSTEVKDEHIPDLCFQKIAFERDGLEVDRTYLILVNNQYVKNGEINPMERATGIRTPRSFERSVVLAQPVQSVASSFFTA